MTDHLHSPNDPHKSVAFKDRVPARDDSKLAGITALAILVAIVLAGGALVYALSGPHDATALVNAPAPQRSDSTVGQGPPAPAPNAQ